MKIEIEVTGTRPLIQHNVRLANPLDAYTRKLKELTSTKKKTDEIIANIAHVEQRAGYYETAKGEVGLPTAALFATIKNGAKKLKLGRQVEMALRFGGADVSPLQIDGRTTTPDDHMKLEQSLFYVSVRNQNNRVMRARPIIHEWSSKHVFEFDERLLSFDELKQILEIAGNDIGVLEWRPRFGTFTAKVKKA